MKDNAKSYTSDLVTIIRAFWHDEDEVNIFNDCHAIKLLPRHWQKILRHPISRRSFKTGTLPIRNLHAAILARARYVEDLALKLANNQPLQYVIAGAGMDTFAARYHDALPQGFKIYELDFPATQEAKKQRLEQCGLATHKNHQYIEIDFTKTSIADCLKNTDYNPKLPTLFCWMGVSYYLDEKTVESALLSMLSLCETECHLVFDYMLDADSLSLSNKAIIRAMKFLTQFSGEPVLARFSPKQLEALSTQSGWHIHNHPTHQAINQTLIKPDSQTLTNLKFSTALGLMHLSR